MTDSSGELVALYLSECGQLLQKFNGAMLEADQQDTLGDPAELFRLLHTLKGSSAMMEYAPLVEVAHAFENILSVVKSQGVSPRGTALRSLIETSLDFSAYFTGELSCIRDGGIPKTNEALQRRLDALARELGVSQPDTADGGKRSGPKASPRQKGEQRALIKLRNCPMPSMRAYIVARSVSSLCLAMETEPDRLNQAAAYADGIQTDGFTIRFIPKEGVPPKAIIQKLRVQPYVASCTPEGAVPEDAPIAEAADGLSQSVTVPQDTVNKLINLMDEISSAENALEVYTETHGRHTRQLDRLLYALRHSIADASITATEIGTHDIGSVFVQMQRTIRSMARELGKEIRLKATGSDVRVEKSVLEILSDSLIHIVRNAADHGIETPEAREAAGKPRAGLIALSAVKRNDTLTVTVEDDGAGVNTQAVLERAERQGKLTRPREAYTDAEACELLLTSCVSTNAKVTRFSGRGVGLDAVTSRIRQAGGSVSIASREGRGTVFSLRIPMTLKVLDGVEILTSDGSRVIVPTNAIRHILTLSSGTDTVVYQGETFAHLPFLPGVKEAHPDGGYALLLEKEYGGRYLYARAVSMMSTYYGKPMPEYVAAVMGSRYIYSGCVTGADTRLRCVLDVDRLLVADQGRGSSERQVEP